MTEKPFTEISSEEAFKKFTVGTPATTTDGKQVQVLSDSYLPGPLADYMTSVGDEKLHHTVFKTRQPGVYYREVELLKSDGSVVSGTKGYSRPWDESSFLTDLHEIIQNK